MENGVSGGEWSSCSETCGNGTKSRHRLCNNPAPDNGGLDCIGEAVQLTICDDVDDCPGQDFIIVSIKNYLVLLKIAIPQQ